jgi:gamma-glutamyltranspeptidase / glutathione hydrolase
VGMVASPHHLASDIGAAVLADGGNAIDAAVAANLALAVLMPFACGVGGDLLAVVWDGDGATGYDGTGRAPAAATPQAVRDRIDGDTMPMLGPLPVTVPGAVDGWFALLERYGTRSFADLVVPARDRARDGFDLGEHGVRSMRASERALGDRPDWAAVYAGAADSGRLVQPDLARALDVLAAQGRDAYYSGPIATAIADHVLDQGGLLAASDLARHTGRWVSPLSRAYRDVEVIELPPPTQGVTALQALAIVDELGPLPPAGPDRTHLLLEATKAAMVERGQHVGDPSTMRLTTSDLLHPHRIADLASTVDADTAAHPPPARPVAGGTVYLAVADDTGMLVSLSQSNFMGFGSGLTVPGWGINLHNRGAYFRLDGVGADQLAPDRQPLHTLIPAMAMRDGQPWMAFGTMGGDNQVGIQVQLLAAMVDDGASPQDAIDAPRWSLAPTDWGVDLEDDTDPAIGDALSSRGHQVRTVPARTIGWAQAIQRDGAGLVGGSDPRSDGGVRTG